MNNVAYFLRHCKIVNDLPSPMSIIDFSTNETVYFSPGSHSIFRSRPERNLRCKQIIYKFDHQKTIICILGFYCTSKRPKHYKKNCANMFRYTVSVQFIIIQHVLLLLPACLENRYPLRIILFILLFPFQKSFPYFFLRASVINQFIYVRDTECSMA